MRLFIFDVDGTLVDSQASIVGSMQDAFRNSGLPIPEAATILRGVGLSVETLMARLAPDQDARLLSDAYRTAFVARRERDGATAMAPFYPGMRALIDRLAAEPETLLGVATGKSRRGLVSLIDGYDLRRHFVTSQTADEHPSKPHPGMIEAALAETGCEPEQAVMIGDTSFDMEMARAAGVTPIGVSWGYHAPHDLDGLAKAVARDADDLGRILDTFGMETA